ncbi:MAG: ribose-5-phosphate isomerase RpiA [Halobacteria archaeon]
MKTTGGSEEEKKAAARSAVEEVEDGNVVGLGTGSTAGYAIEMLGERVEEGLDIVGVPTSFQSERNARHSGIPVVSLPGEHPDLTIDGADLFDPDLSMIKGGGASHTRERLVAEVSDRVVIVADSSKHTDVLDQPVPLEVLEIGAEAVMERVSGFGGDPRFREAVNKDGVVITDDGNPVVDADFGEIPEPSSLSDRLDTVTGVVCHGLFVDVADEIHYAREDEVEVLE